MCYNDRNKLSYLESIAKQYLADIDTLEFVSKAKEFIESPYEFNGNNEESMKALYSWAKGIRMGGM